MGPGLVATANSARNEISMTFLFMFFEKVVKLQTIKKSDNNFSSLGAFDLIALIKIEDKRQTSIKLKRTVAPSVIYLQENEISSG